MSANNILIISREDGYFTASDKCVETGLGQRVLQANSLSGIVKKAEHYCRTNEVEYNIRFEDLY